MEARHLLVSLITALLVLGCQATDDRTAPIDATGPAPSSEHLKPGFAVYEEDGRLWVFEDGSADLDTYLEVGEPAKHVIRPGVGPDGRTIKAPDNEIVLAYLAAAPGFETFVVDGRIWVFRAGDPEVQTFLATGEPAKHVIRPAVGPLRMTVKGADPATIDDYLRAVGS